MDKNEQKRFDKLKNSFGSLVHFLNLAKEEDYINDPHVISMIEKHRKEFWENGAEDHGFNTVNFELMAFIYSKHYFFIGKRKTYSYGLTIELEGDSVNISDPTKTITYSSIEDIDKFFVPDFIRHFNYRSKWESLKDDSELFTKHGSCSGFFIANDIMRKQNITFLSKEKAESAIHCKKIEHKCEDIEALKVMVGRDLLKDIKRFNSLVIQYNNRWSSDPFYSALSNMELVRNHIEYDLHRFKAVTFLLNQPGRQLSLF